MKLHLLGASIVCLFILISCDKESSNGTEESLNNNIEGRIFIGNSVNGGWILDVNTGHYAKIPQTNWGSDNAYHGLADFSASPLPYGNGDFVETVENCVIEFGNDRDCIVFHDQEGNITDSFEIPDIALGAARLSPDGNLAAIGVANEGTPFKIVNIYNRSGELIRTLDQRSIDDDDFSWISNTELVYISNNSLYISNSNEPITTFTGDTKVMGAPAVSPDFTKIVFTLGQDTSQGVEGTIWMIQRDGTGVRQLTVKEQGFPNEPSHKSAIWSPDGKWIFVVDGTSIEGNAYVIPSDAEKVELTQENSTLARPVLSYFQEIYEYNGNDPIELSSQFGVDHGDIYWIR